MFSFVRRRRTWNGAAARIFNKDDDNDDPCKCRMNIANLNPKRIVPVQPVLEITNKKKQNNTLRQYTLHCKTYVRNERNERKKSKTTTTENSFVY